jgi:hypothetical protein
MTCNHPKVVVCDTRGCPTCYAAGLEADAPKRAKPRVDAVMFHKRVSHRP